MILRLHMIHLPAAHRYRWLGEVYDCFDFMSVRDFEKPKGALIIWHGDLVTGKGPRPCGGIVRKNPRLQWEGASL